MPEATKTNSFDYESEIWKIADYVWGPIKHSEMNRVILPFALLRRLECALEPTRDAVCKALAEHEMEWGRDNDNYCRYSKKSFYNVTSFRLNNLGSTDTLNALNEYINGFSPNAREILLKFKMHNTCQILADKDLLYEVCMKFSAFDLRPEVVSDREMTNIYEHLIQRFGESIAENAEDFMTPRDIIQLSVGMVFANEDELMQNDDGTLRTLYDGCAGTCGFITDALDTLEEWHVKKNMIAPSRIVPYGQEIEDESWAMGKASLLLRNISNNQTDIYDAIRDMSSHIALGNTLSDDKFKYETFNYQLTNPPYGKSYEPEYSKVLEEHMKGFKGRFGAGLPPKNDSAMLFIQNVVSKFAPLEKGGGKAGIILAGSPLFRGDAGKGESNIRRWLLEKDYIDCIVKLGTGLFFRTGINTYLWVLSNKKPENRKGKVQLIDASEIKTTMKKNLGKKNAEISKEQAEDIIRLYVDGTENEISVIVPVTEFMYRKVTTQRPLKAKLVFANDRLNEFFDLKPMAKLSDSNKKVLENALTETEEKPYDWADDFGKNIRQDMTKPEATAAQITKAVRDTFTVKDSSGDVVTDKRGNVVADPDLTDSENIPFNTTFEDYMAKEVLPFAPDTWIDETVRDDGPLQDGKVGVVGTNISFNKYFYHYEEPRKPEDIAKEIMDLEISLDSFMEGVLK